MAVSSFSSVSDVLRWKYDVFVSFGHQDTDRDFVSHLIRAFNQKSISTSVDAEGICRDDRPSEELPDAVQQSRLFIVVFSKRYAHSRWRLEELVQMLNCVDTNNQKLLPVFYRVDPSDVRRATGAFAEAFQKHECNPSVDKEEVMRWRSALTRATNYFGWDLPYYRNEADVIEEIVQSVFDKLICFSSYGSRRKYDVFLNFRGADTRKTFVVHLYKALYLKVINTFMDGEELRKGNSISDLLNSVKESRVSIVVFSKDYASSRWCLKELVQILECMDKQNQIVVPVFYQVDRSKVCNPEAFTKHDSDPRVEKEDLQSWMSALTRATNLPPHRWDQQNYEDDAKLIEVIVQHIGACLHK
ncbi:hypothetical protein C1H46_016961 [Malus baccata]|uniref:ADP-ribosyl cyclase/cyclic ADP-ribose hydrolase n=1 Tax=Malus baccata TaxID=106549 RepID=A0A540MFM9_MALBA|nr:hypothetical protein C1H46_016961 [Malus baccata]